MVVRVGVPLRHRFGTNASHTCAFLSAPIGFMRALADKPTVRQVYALASVLCERAGEGFPETREEASELIERLRIESGHPAPRLEDAPFRARR